MKKNQYIPLGFIFLALVLTVVFIPTLAKNGGNKDSADGVWCYAGVDPNPPDFAFGYRIGQNDFFTGSYISDWTGTFTGPSLDNGLVIWRNFELPPPPVGPAMFVDLITFDSVKVGDKTGGLELYLYGERETDFWDGLWFIVDASGDLEGLEGRGKWWQWEDDAEGVCEAGFLAVHYSVDDLSGLD
jgi:hypothetical protein